MLEQQQRRERKKDGRRQRQEMQLWIVRMVSSVWQSSSAITSAIISRHAKVGVTCAGHASDAATCSLPSVAEGGVGVWICIHVNNVCNECLLCAYCLRVPIL